MANSVATSLPSPVGGLNLKDPIDAMPATDAIKLINIIPDTANVRLRGGCRVQSSNLSAGVDTLVEWNGLTTSKLIAFSGDSMFDCSNSGVSATLLAYSKASAKWQCVNFGGYLVCVNGVDTPIKYEGTTVSSAVYTGIADPTTLINIAVYKNRLYLVPKNSQSFWYGATDAVQGALTEFYIGSYFRQGGYVSYVGSWTRDTGSGISDLLLVVSSKGEILLYEGSYPGDSSFGLVGRLSLGRPIGYRSFFYYGPDLVAIAEDGVYPLSKLMQMGITGESNRISNKIDLAFIQNARSFFDLDGWCGIVYPEGRYMLINVPQSSTMAKQYIMNLITGAWCEINGWNANCWSLFNGHLYYGGKDGRVYRADIDSSDNGVAIDWDIRSAFNYLDDLSSEKRIGLARPVVTESSTVSPKIYVDMDFKNNTVPRQSAVGTGGTAWDTTLWDVATWGDQENQYSLDWQSVEGIGKTMSYKMSGSFKDLTFTLNSVNVTFEKGGFI